MSDFFKELEKKYYIFSTIILVLIIGQTVPNISVNFFFTAIWESIFIPSIIITFWDNFMNMFPSTSSEPPKIKKPYMITIIILFYTIFFNQIMFYYLADIPNAINKKYVTTEGKISYVTVKNRIRAKQFFEMNDRIYFNYASDFTPVEKNEKYRVTILKNSKYVFGIQKLNSLSQKEKMEDFNHLFEIISKNYPYLEVNKRIRGIDWIGKKENYLNEIKNTKNDEEFFITLDKILRDLNNGHTQIINKEFLKYILSVYSKIIKESSDGLKNWQNLIVKTATDKTVLSRYELDDTYINSYNENDAVSIGGPIKNVSIADIIDKKIAYIGIPAMLPSFQMEEEKNTINGYLNKIKDYKALIIDIRGNGGGSTTYWSEYLVPKLIDKPVNFKTNYFFKNGEIVNKIKNYETGFDSKKSDEYKKVSDIDKSKMPNLSPEIFTDFYYYTENNQTIKPLKDSVKFKGKIYLLVDRNVFSASEALAVFAKTTGFATLIGEKTGGDGIGSDPWIEKLPNSSYLFRMPKEMGTTSDGTSNFEYKTIPDFVISNTQKLGIFVDDNCIKKVVELEHLSF